MFTSLVQKAQSFIETNEALRDAFSVNNDRKTSKSVLFRHQFRLPDTQNPLDEISAHLILHAPKITVKAASGDKEIPQRQTAHYEGRLHLSEGFLCFSTKPSSFHPSSSLSASSIFTGQTHGSGPVGNGFTLPLCTIRRVERLNSSTFEFALSLTTWNGFSEKSGSGNESKVPPRKFTLDLIGSRQACERFCDGLKKGLRQGTKGVSNLRVVSQECYSEYLLAVEGVKDSKTEGKDANAEKVPPDVGLGMLFRYPGDARKLRDKSKMRLWREYLMENGRNSTIIRQPNFHKLIRVGLPNRLRGEMWELTSGSLFLRLENPRLYQDTLKKHEGQPSMAIDEIEKDLNRSLPEYPGFQSEEGIGRLRRVLTAYSWVNASVGYCQAMNIVVAALLIFLSETQAFYILSVLCDRLLPGYYSTTMYGTLLDQRVFESLVEKTMPILWDHLIKSDVQLSVVSLPWFLSLYINSMPLVFAFRVLDMFFLEGPKVLFQIGLAILRVNGEELLDAADDGTFISVLKNYFARLDESAHPKSENAKFRAITKFQELLVVALQEFSGITQQAISDQRAKHKDSVLESIENFAKRTSIRNLGPDSKKLGASDLGFLYDRFYGTLYERQQRDQIRRQEIDQDNKMRKSKANQAATGIAGDDDVEMGRVGLGPSPTQMNYDAFREFLAGIARWAMADSAGSPHNTHAMENSHGSWRGSKRASEWGLQAEPADHDFLQRLFGKWDTSQCGELSLQNVVTGMARVKSNTDIMATIEYFFELYDDDGTGKVDREGILRMSEGLLFLSRRGFGPPTPAVRPGRRSTQTSAVDSINDAEQNNGDVQFLSGISAFIRRCFEYADPDSNAGKSETTTDSSLENDTTSAAKDLSSFSIGDDGDANDDLMAFDDGKSAPSKLSSTTSHPLDSSNETPSASDAPPTPATPMATTANAALDPSKPLHITLPTFRMLILADETLEHFFDTAFPSSFHLAEPPAPTSPALSFTNDGTPHRTFSGSSSNNLTTFANLKAATPSSIPTHSFDASGQMGHAGASAGVVPPGNRGLRGMLDNIVTDGMRVAAEVRRRMDDAQKELERHGSSGQHEDEDDEGEGEDGGDALDLGVDFGVGSTGGGGGVHGSGQHARKSSQVRSGDRDLLEGAEAKATDGTEGGTSLMDMPVEESTGEGKEKRTVEFETA